MSEEVVYSNLEDIPNSNVIGARADQSQLSSHSCLAIIPFSMIPRLTKE